MCTLGVIDNKILFKNYDWHESQEIKIEKEQGVIFVVNPRKRAVAALNKYGVGLVSALVLGKDALNPREWIKPFFHKLKTANELIIKLKEGLEFTGYNWIIADPKQAFAVEIWGKKIIATEINTAVRTNHFFKLKHGPQKLNDYPSSFIRFKRASKLIETANPDIDSAKRILSDHENGLSENSICRHGKINTYGSIILDLASKKLYFAKGNPCSSKFIEIKC